VVGTPRVLTLLLLYSAELMLRMDHGAESNFPYNVVSGSRCGELSIFYICRKKSMINDKGSQNLVFLYSNSC